ncbi:MAG: helix-turn-helix transcriptional regulator [Bacteriovoracaceae bacterium]|nr:helix-turn-helix transcriptional regulator [Bacteriovoracaceae bacterium]
MDIKIEIKIEDTLKKLRKTCKVSQHKLASYLQIDQAGVSRLEKGCQNIQIDTLIKLSKFYQLDIEQIIKGTINYYALAKNFGIDSPLPKRYQGVQELHMKELMPIIAHLRKFQGDTFIYEVLNKLGLDDLLFLPPDQKCNSLVMSDIIALSMEKGALSATDIPFITSLSFDSQYLGHFNTSFSKLEKSKDLIHSWVLNSDFFEGIFKFSIFSEKISSLTLNMDFNNIEIRDEFKKKGLENFILLLKQSYLKQLPHRFNLPSLEVGLLKDPFIGRGRLEVSF